MNNLIIKITRVIKYTVCFSLLFTKALSEDSSEGEKLYLSHGCYSCHGYYGTGRYPLANDISGIMTSEELFTMFLRLRADLNPVSPSNSMPNYSKNVIDDSEAKTLAAASSREESVSKAKSTKVEQAQMVGKLIAERAKTSGVENVVFDRGGFLYHGRVKALAESAREAGLKF